MGLIKAFSGAMNKTISNQWRDYYECTELSPSILISKGERMNKTNVNTRSIGGGSILSKGSKIVVKDGQCAIVVCDGILTELCAEPGGYTYNPFSKPSIFLGDLDSGVVSSFKSSILPLNYISTKGKVSRLFFINISEICDIGFKTEQPLLFNAYYPELSTHFSVSLNCKGFFSYRIANPIVFFKYCNSNFNIGEKINTDMTET